MHPANDMFSQMSSFKSMLARKFYTKLHHLVYIIVRQVVGLTMFCRMPLDI